MTRAHIAIIKPVPSALSLGVPLLQRKCNCGGAVGLSSECSECQTKRLLGKPLQTKLHINEPGDEYEQEADQVAEQVLTMPDATVNAKTLLSGETPLVQREASRISGAGMETAPSIVQDVLSSPGQPLDLATRAFFAPRFGHDFANVRVHADTKAAQAAASVNSRAYTIEDDIVFGAGQYDLVTANGRNLLAHELTHVVQQSMGADRKIQRAEMAIDSLKVAVNFDHLEDVAEADIAGQLLSMIQSWIGPDLAESFQADIDTLSPDARRWTMFAIQLLMDNAKDRMSGELAADFSRLMVYAPQAAYPPAPDELFVREVLRVAGRLETAATASLTMPRQRTEKKIKKIVEPRQMEQDLDVDELKRRLVPALEHWLRKKDPLNWSEEGTRSLSDFQSLGDIILAAARTFFSPYGDAARSNIYTQIPAWKGATHIYDVGTKSITEGSLLNLLTNRAELVGRNTDPSNSDFIDTSIFTDVSFNSTRESDRQALNEILKTMLENGEMHEIAERLERVTGERTRSSGIGPMIGLATQYDAATYRTACEGHWKQVDTLCHEIVHAMVHPRFEAVVVPFSQIISEGFTEVLGAQLHNDHVIPKAKDDPGFKSTIEAEVRGKPCPDPAKATIDYGAAGQAAEEIRQLVGDNNFRAAYFLGKPELAGLPG